MRRVAILHVGDVHYPQHKDARDVDVKDRGFSHPLRRTATRNKLSGAIEKAARVMKKIDPAIMICGDITSYADPAGYEAGVRALRDALDLDAAPPDSWHVAIGNHDLDRDAVDPSKIGTEQYAFAVDAWKPHSVLALERPRTTVFTRNNATLQLTTLNSCVGSGAHRNLPDKVRDQVAQAAQEALDATKSGTLDDEAIRDALDLVYEQLDTPAFDADCIVELVENMRTLDRRMVPVVLAHHNLLPQGTPRLAAYTELVNGGQVRGQISSCLRPVLYLHGHIHEDAVEVVERYGAGRGTLLLISAPLLVDGFNVVTVEFSDTGRLLGAVVQRYRARHGGDVEADDHDTIRVPVPDPKLPRNRLSPTIGATLVASGHTRFADLVAVVQYEDPTATEDEIADAVLEAEWDGHLTVQNREEGDRNLWTVVNLDLR